MNKLREMQDIYSHLDEWKVFPLKKVNVIKQFEILFGSWNKDVKWIQ